MTSKLTRERIELIANFHRAMTLPPSHAEIEELARMALAAMDSKPVAEVVSIYGDPEAFGEREIRPLVGIQQMPYGTKLYRHVQQPVVESEPVAEVLSNRPGNDTSTIDRALPVGTQLYRHAQPAPVVPEEKLIPNTLSMYAVDAVAAIAEVKGWNACRAAMLAAAPQSPGSEPATVPGKWIPVSERMPEDEQEVLTINRMGHCFVSFFDKHSGLFFDRLDAPAACCIEHVLVTHWMPLPAAPSGGES
ncbi:TPA: DUF551 domain-containing protein [Klebsiella pneumoniae]|nr:DUF551 domain-containing protein [Klebsiella pneumoniae]